MCGLMCASALAWKYLGSTSVGKTTRGLALSVLLGLGLGLGSVMLPVPPVDIASLSSVFGNRTDGGEAAVVSRWNLLHALKQKIAQHPIMGSGFGAAVPVDRSTHRQTKRRSLYHHRLWMGHCWLEHWVKFGLIGIPLMLGLSVRSDGASGNGCWEIWLRIAGVSVLAALAAIRVFTPYLNHPLGITVLLFGEAFVERGKRMLQ